MRQKNHKPEILSLLAEICKEYKDESFCQHLQMAFLDYENIDDITDKEAVRLLEIYKAAKDLDITIEHDSSLDKVWNDAMNLNIGEEDDEDDFFNENNF